MLPGVLCRAAATCFWAFSELLLALPPHPMQMLEEIDSLGGVASIPTMVARAKDKNDSFRLMGFGHRVYKSYDPRAKLMRQVSESAQGVVGCWCTRASPGTPPLSFAPDLHPTPTISPLHNTCTPYHPDTPCALSHPLHRSPTACWRSWGARTRCWTSPWSWRRLRCRTTTSSSGEGAVP